MPADVRPAVEAVQPGDYQWSGCRHLPRHLVSQLHQPQVSKRCSSAGEFLSSLLTSQPLIWMREILFQGTECSEGRQCRSGECLALTDLEENISTTSTPAPSTTTTTERQERNRPFRILYSMKVCDFFKLLSPHNYPSFCND